MHIERWILAVAAAGCSSNGQSSDLRYRSDCTLTNPVPIDPCQGTPPSTTGVASCASLQVTGGQACAADAPRCFVESTCSDGRVVASDFLECVDEPSDLCMTRSSRRFKRDITYLTPAEIDQLARQVDALRIASYRYRDADARRLGFITEDAPGAPFVTADGSHVDLYGLLAATIATVQTQERRILELEQRCRPR
jgi:hypothetical protein